MASAIRFGRTVRKFTDTEQKETEPTAEQPGSSESSSRQFVIVTKDFTGLGWAKKLQEEGEAVTVATVFEEDDADLLKKMKQVGEGWVVVLPLKRAIAVLSGPDTIWVFAENCFVDEAKQLIEDGQQVFPPGIELGEHMEHDRQYAVDIVKKAGLDVPETFEFSSREEGLSFLDAHADTAYVFKPDDGKFNYLTFVPIRKEDPDANRETYHYLAHMKEHPGTFILQQRIPLEEALEVCAEVWLYEGEPFMATVGLETKRKNTYDLGEMCGCSGDFAQHIPLDCKLITETVGKLLPFYKQQKYTGLADVNVIYTPDNVPHFLEVCNRFGYNFHVTCMLALLKDGQGFGQLIVDYLAGNVSDIESRFHDDIGGSLTIFLDHPRPGLPVHIDEKTRKQFYPFDGYKEDDDDTLLLTGYSDEVGIFVARGSTVEAAAHACADAVAFDEAVSVPDCYYRWDLWETNFYNAPVLRYNELKKRGLLS